MAGTDREELRQRQHFINQCEELGNLAKSAKEDLKRENKHDAKLHLSEMRGRLKSVLEDLDRYNDSGTEQ